MPEERLGNNIETSFIQTALKQNLRIDGRKCNEFRKLCIEFSGDWGCALVSMGDTKILVQVKCEIGVPKATRPNEGALFINVEMGEVACINSDVYDTQLLLLNRLLERTFKESHCIDLESLCIRSEEHVWVLRVDVTILNYDGNLNDTCSAAVLAALMHFRRPDASIIDDRLYVYRSDEKEYLFVALQHYPVTVTHCVFNNGHNTLVDPLLVEEAVAESRIIFGFNSYQEMCTVNLGGSILANVSVLQQCAHVSAKRATEVVKQVKHMLQLDLLKREKNEFIGLHKLLAINKEKQRESVEKLPLKMRHNKNEPKSADSTNSIYKLSTDSLIKTNITSDNSQNTNKLDDIPVNQWMVECACQSNDDENDGSSLEDQQSIKSPEVSSGSEALPKYFAKR